MSGSTPTSLPPSTDSIGAYSALVPTLMTPAFWMSAGSFEKRGALSVPLDDSEELPPLSVWSPQAESSKAPATARDPTAARRVRAAVVRRVELAVMVGSSGGWMEMPMGRHMPMGRREHTPSGVATRSEEHTSELQSRRDLVCRLLLEKKKEK